jgi:hypothetical protein
MKSRIWIIVIGLLTVASIGGCGAGSGSSSIPGGPLSKTAFVRLGNEICTKAEKRRNEGLKEAAEDAGAGGSAELKSLVDLALESVGGAAEELSELRPPASRREAMQALVMSLEAEMKKLGAAPSEAVSSSSFKASNAAARRAGLPACVI